MPMVADKRIPVTEETRNQLNVLKAKTDDVDTYDQMIEQLIEESDRS